MLKASHVRTNRAALHGRVDVEHARERPRLVPDDADGVAVQSGEAADDVLGETLVDLEELPVVDDALDDLLHVVRLGRLVRDERVELRRPPACGSVGSANGGGSRLFCGRNESR